MPGDTDFRVKLFGDPKVRALPAGKSFPAKGYQLIAYLSMARGYRAPRKKLAAMLWDSESDKQAFNSLRQLLARIRRLLPDQTIIETEGSQLVLSEPYRHSDLHLFDKTSASRTGDALGDILSIFEGELLEGLDEQASDEFQSWLHQLRNSLRDRFLYSASAYLFDLTRFGRADSSMIEKLATQMLALDPEREETFRTLIQIYGRNGLVAKAREIYADLLDMLKREHDGTLDPDTVKVARRVFSYAKPEAADPTPEPLPEQTNAQPRVAIMMPEWLLNPSSKGLFRALVCNIADELARYHSFSILGPHTSLRLDHDLGIPLDNSILRADYSVSGFAREENGKPMLFLRLAKCDTRELAWSAEFPFSVEELVDFQRHLTRRVASSLASEIERDRARELDATEQPQAYLAFLSGVEEMMLCTLPDLRRARRHFAAALDLDRYFATAHSALAKCMLYEWLILGANDPEGIATARRSAAKALEIDGNDGLILSTMASIDMYQHDVDAALVRYGEAETLAPNSSELLVGYANALSSGGNPKEGLEKFEHAISLDPILPDDHWWAGASIAFDDHQYHRAIGYCSMMQNEDPALRVLTACHALTGNYTRAKEYGARLKENYPDQTAAQMVGITPISDREVSDRFLEGLRIAGID